MEKVSPQRWLARKLGLGRLALSLRIIRETGIRTTIQTAAARRTLLPRILKAPPIPAGSGEIDLCMLLQKQRLLEGAWAIYSFLRFAGMPLRVVVHSDGSLDSDCVAKLSRVFPGISIVDRATADSTVQAELERRQLHTLAALRRRVVQTLKLFDTMLLGQSPWFILLDSDILTFSKPEELIARHDDPNGGPPHRYSVDNNDRGYCLERTLLQSLLNQEITPRLNAGLLLLQREGISLERMEIYARKANLLQDSRVNIYFTEQTLLACDLPIQGAIGLDTARYTICGDPNDPATVTGHYCGGGFWATRFYREGLPRLAKEFGLT